MDEAKPIKVRKKPVVVEAMRWDGDVRSGHPVTRWINYNGGRARYTPGTVQDLYIETLEGNMVVSPGDYVIRGVNGEFYPCKPDIFAKTYEEVQ